MRTETRTVPKLEFVPLPDEATAPCLVSYPPMDAEDGTLDYADLPPYLARVLGTLEECNEKLEQIRKLQPTDVTVSGTPDAQVMKDFSWEVRPSAYHENKPMVVIISGFNSIQEMRAGFLARTGGKYAKTAQQLRAVSIWYVLNDVRYCEMFVVRPKLYNDEEWRSWGHELGHCVYGSWHPPLKWE